MQLFHTLSHAAGQNPRAVYFCPTNLVPHKTTSKKAHTVRGGGPEGESDVVRSTVLSPLQPYSNRQYFAAFNQSLTLPC